MIGAFSASAALKYARTRIKAFRLSRDWVILTPADWTNLDTIVKSPLIQVGAFCSRAQARLRVRSCRIGIAAQIVENLPDRTRSPDRVLRDNIAVTILLEPCELTRIELWKRRWPGDMPRTDVQWVRWITDTT